jgi:hypothetical protein
MPSFLDDENQMLIDATMAEIGEQLVEDWINNNLDEGQLYSDYQIASMSSSNYLKDKFNKFYELIPEDQYYLEAE